MNTPHVPVDLRDLVDAEVTTMSNGEHHIYFPTESFGFSFRTHPGDKVVEAILVDGMYFLGSYGDGVLFMEYTGNPKYATWACRLTARSLTKSFPGEEISLLAVRALEVTGNQALVQLCHQPEVHWVLGYDDDGQFSINTANKS